MLAELADESIAKVVFTKHDHRWLIRYGIPVNGPIIDVQVMAWVVNERTDLDLATVSELYAPGTVKRSRIKMRAGVLSFECDDGSWVPLIDAPLDELCAYNVGDLESTQGAYLELKRRIYFDGLANYYETDALPLARVLVGMETRGVPIDLPQTQELRERLEDEAYAYEHRLRIDAGMPDEFNLGSAKQLSEWLYQAEVQTPGRIEITKDQRAELKRRLEDHWVVDFDGLVIDKVGTKYASGKRTWPGLNLNTTTETDAGQKSTSAKTLRVEQDHPLVDTLLERSSRKTIAGYLKGFETHTVDGRVYGRFNQTGTKTGRLSSSSPNLQNVPARGDMGRACRSLFRPEPGRVFVHGDYGQLEPRLMAHWSGDPVLREVYDEGKDIYLETAQRIFRCSLEDAQQYRNPMKVYVLALGYGSGAETLKRQLAEYGHRVPLHEVEATLYDLKRVYSVFFEWKEDVISDAANEGYVETLAGHRRRFGGLTKRQEFKSWRAQSGDERQAVNAVIQGSAADIVARTMLAVDAFPMVDLLVQVHDELLMEADDGTVTPEVLGAIQRAAEVGHGFKLLVPLEFVPRVVPTWAEGKD